MANSDIKVTYRDGTTRVLTAKLKPKHKRREKISWKLQRQMNSAFDEAIQRKGDD